MIKKIENIYRFIFPKRLTNWRIYANKLKGLSGIEIGGPSPAFTKNGFLPLYKIIGSLDGCNFSSNTVWEGTLTEGLNYKYGNRKGYQFISDGTNLNQIPNGHYDFILSCHSLEHFANPIKALTEWKRILKDGGYILLVVPHKDNTFDHNRPLTSIEHLISDFNNDVQENDATHFEEVIALHDISMDGGIKDLESLKMRTADNFNNRCVHHHIFNTPLITKLAQQLNLKICDIQHFNPFHIIALLQKNDSIITDNSFYLDPQNEVYLKAKFPSDKIW